MRAIVAIAILSGALVAQFGSVSAVKAQAGDAQPAFVYGINAAVPNTFVGTFAPPGDDVYLLANEASVVSPRTANLYFWPITNEFRADWAMRNDPVPGTLEILRGGTLLAELTATDYTIQFTQKDGETSATLFLGQDAIDAEAEFRARQQAFQEATQAYQDAEQAWLDKAQRANERQKAGETVDIPPPPEPPAPIGVFSNGLNEGFPIDLDPGSYRIRLRAPDGSVVPESERALTVFAPRRTGVGFSVVPETRWTTPLDSSTQGDVIFGAAGSNVYLEPRLTREFPARSWALLQNPQRPAGGAGGWEWVNGERLAGGVLEVLQGGRVVDRRHLTPFRVEQIPGRQLGYEVLDLTANPGDTDPPDFEAFPIRLETPGERFQIRLVSASGDVMAGSERQVSAAGSVPMNRLFLLPFAPLALGAAIAALRNRRVKASRDLAGVG